MSEVTILRPRKNRHTHILMYSCTHVLLYSCTLILIYLCTYVLTYSWTHVLMYFCTHVLILRPGGWEWMYCDDSHSRLWFTREKKAMKNMFIVYIRKRGGKGRKITTFFSYFEPFPPKKIFLHEIFLETISLSRRREEWEKSETVHSIYYNSISLSEKLSISIRIKNFHISKKIQISI